EQRDHELVSDDHDGAGGDAGQPGGVRAAEPAPDVRRVARGTAWFFHRGTPGSPVRPLLAGGRVAQGLQEPPKGRSVQLFLGVVGSRRAEPGSAGGWCVLSVSFLSFWRLPADRALVEFALAAFVFAPGLA